MPASGRDEHPLACDAAIACLAAKSIAAGWRIVGALLHRRRLDHHRRLRRPRAPAVDEVPDRLLPLLARASSLLRGFVALDVASRDFRDARAVDLVFDSGAVEHAALGRSVGRRRRRDDRRGRTAWASPQGHRRHGRSHPDFGGQRAVEGGRTGNGRRIGLVRLFGRPRLLLRILLLQRVLRRSALRPARQEIARFHFRNLRDRRAASVAH